MDLLKSIFKGDKVIWIIFLCLCLISIIEVFSAASTLTYKSGDHWGPITQHSIILMVGAVVVVFLHNVPYKWFHVAAGLMHIVWPFILGAAIAFILNVPMRNIERHLPVFGEGSRLRRPVSLVVTILLVTGGLFLVIFVVAPQLVKTFLNLQGSIPVFFAGVRDEAERIFASNPQILEYMNQLEVDWQEVFQNMVAFLKSGARTIQ